MKKIYLILLVLSVVTFSACSKSPKLAKADITITKADSTSIPLNIEIAKTPAECEHGYMERKNIPDGTGMLFVFQKDQILSFWMKNTPHPLSIAYLDSTGKIRDIFDMKPYSLDPVVSTTSVRYALEVPQGWFKSNGIKKGDFVNLPSVF